jgi:hypothetical protein
MLELQRKNEKRKIHLESSAGLCMVYTLGLLFTNAVPWTFFSRTLVKVSMGDAGKVDDCSGWIAFSGAVLIFMMPGAGGMCKIFRQ